MVGLTLLVRRMARPLEARDLPVRPDKTSVVPLDHPLTAHLDNPSTPLLGSPLTALLGSLSTLLLDSLSMAHHIVVMACLEVMQMDLLSVVQGRLMADPEQVGHLVALLVRLFLAPHPTRGPLPAHLSDRASAGHLQDQVQMVLLPIRTLTLLDRILISLPDRLTTRHLSTALADPTSQVKHAHHLVLLGQQALRVSLPLVHPQFRRLVHMRRLMLHQVARRCPQWRHPREL